MVDLAPVKYAAGVGTVRLMGTAEIAARLGVTRVRVHQIVTTDPSFPAPLGEIKAGKVWLAEDVERWIAEHRPTKA